MKIVIADDLPTSAADLLRSEGWTVDATAGRPLDQLKADLADADAIVVRSATKKQRIEAASAFRPESSCPNRVNRRTLSPCLR